MIRATKRVIAAHLHSCTGCKATTQAAVEEEAAAAAAAAEADALAAKRRTMSRTERSVDSPFVWPEQWVDSTVPGGPFSTASRQRMLSRQVLMISCCKGGKRKNSLVISQEMGTV